ncbi:MAG: MBL fold metallo-hydrolase [Chlamydiia bacterium]|nr:MBL fold metallo-hydrolase [Chlamydiia bacterium]
MCVVDPTRDVDIYLETAIKEGYTITDIVETHVHADFVSGAPELKHRLEGKPLIHCSALGGKEWIPLYADKEAHEGHEVKLGKIRLRARHTPGHTPEHVCWELFDDGRSSEEPWLLFTGDFLFIGSIGRPDLLGKKEQESLAHQLYNSAFQVLPTLPDFTEVYPAHGAGSLCGKAIGSRTASTVGYERHYSPVLQEKPEKEWVEALMNEMPKAPPYFSLMKKINVKGAPLLGAARPPLKALTELDPSATLLDVRGERDFAAAHIPGSMNIPYGSMISSWAGWLVSYEKPIILVLEREDQAKEVVTQLQRIGLDRILGFVEGGIDGWLKRGGPINSYPVIDVQHLAAALRGKKIALLDVRSDEEYHAGHIENSLHVQGGQLPVKLHELPKDREIVTVCGMGFRAAIAAAYLQSQGFKQITYLDGGMQAWRAAGYPIA